LPPGSACRLFPSVMTTPVLSILDYCVGCAGALGGCPPWPSSLLVICSSGVPVVGLRCGEITCHRYSSTITVTANTRP
jgi:hypothetical protein